MSEFHSLEAAIRAADAKEDPDELAAHVERQRQELQRIAEHARGRKPDLNRYVAYLESSGYSRKQALGWSNVNPIRRVLALRTNGARSCTSRSRPRAQGRRPVRRARVGVSRASLARSTDDDPHPLARFLDWLARLLGGQR